MKDLKNLASCMAILICLCVVVPLTIFVYQKSRRYHDEQVFFEQHNAAFAAIVALAVEHRTPGCTVVDSDDTIAEIIEPDQIHVCYDDDLAIKFLWVGGKNHGPLYCYIPKAKKSDDVPFAESAYTTNLYAELPNHWFLCDSAEKEA